MTHWAEQYIGQEWIAGETDCWTFFRLIQRQHFNRHIPEVDVSALDRLSVTRAFVGHDERRNWYEIEAPQEGDAALMTRSRFPSHVGVWVNGGVLHSLQNIGVVWQQLPRLKREWANVTFYRHRGPP